MEADVARFYCANKEQIFETRSFKDIDTVRNMVARVWSVLLLQSVQEVHVTNQERESIQSNYIASYGLNIQVACTPSMDDDIRHYMR